MPTVACGVMPSSQFTVAEYGFKIVADGKHNIVCTREAAVISTVAASVAAAAMTSL